MHIAEHRRIVDEMQEALAAKDERIAELENAYTDLRGGYDEQATMIGRDVARLAAADRLANEVIEDSREAGYCVICGSSWDDGKNHTTTCELAAYLATVDAENATTEDNDFSKAYYAGEIGVDEYVERCRKATEKETDDD
jgi:hypothetical protein